MTVVHTNLAIVILLVACATAQTAAAPATVRTITYSRDGGDLRIVVTLSSPVTPTAETAIHPDRILLDLPGVICTDQTGTVEVSTNGVRRVRAAQHSTDPVIARIVLDLDRAYPYTLKSEGNHIIVTVSSAVVAVRSGAPVAAKSGSLTGIFRRKLRTSEVSADENAPKPASELPAKTAKLGSYIPPSLAGSTPWFPSAHTDTQSSSEPAATSAPSASFATSSTAGKTSPAGSVAQQSFPPVQVAPGAGGANSSNSIPPFTEPTPATPATQVSTNTTGTSLESPVPATAAASTAPPATETSPGANTDSAPSSASSSIEAPDNASTGPSDAHKAVSTTPAAEAAPVPEAQAANPEPTAATETAAIVRTDDPSLRTVFKVKYVAEGVAYLEGGSAQGLSEGMKLYVEDNTLPAKQGDSATTDDPRVVAELQVSAVADTSSVTDIHAPKRPVKVGDLAYLSASDAAALVAQRALSPTRQYPAVISFTADDTLDEEAREEVPRPPLPSVNRARGRIGLDYMDTISHGTTNLTSSDVGVVFRGDITRIGGTYWNLSGYWRGRLTQTSPASQQTLQDLINRTYHLSLTYDDPSSNFVAGVGRLYLPWAPSLDTIDGGYFGYKPAKGTTLGFFGGSTPDPSSWDYTPDRVISGAFINFEGGEYDALHYTSTAGAGLSMVNWQTDRPFLFFEDSASYGRAIAVYESAQFDNPHGNAATPSPGTGLGRSFFTVRIEPHPRVELDFNHNYFRDIPTFDPTLIGTGLLDKFLFQGFSAGARVEVLKQIWVSTNMGRSSRTGDATSSLNEMYGLTFGHLPWLGLRADAHYARFNSSFGSGSYEAVTISRQMNEALRLEVLAGKQTFSSALTTNSDARFITGTIETTLGPHYYLQGNFTTNHGQVSYEQIMLSLGYRFDSRKRKQ
jgi:hypothetical protein